MIQRCQILSMLQRVNKVRGRVVAAYFVLPKKKTFVLVRNLADGDTDGEKDGKKQHNGEVFFWGGLLL